MCSENGLYFSNLNTVAAYIDMLCFCSKNLAEVVEDGSASDAAQLIWIHVMAGIGPTTAALCALDLAKCLGPKFKELIYVGTSGWSAAVGGILNAGHCEKANPTKQVSSLTEG